MDPPASPTRSISMSGELLTSGSRIWTIIPPPVDDDAPHERQFTALPPGTERPFAGMADDDELDSMFANVGSLGREDDDDFLDALRPSESMQQFAASAKRRFSAAVESGQVMLVAPTESAIKRVDVTHQGNLEMNTSASIRERALISHHPSVAEMLRGMWALLPKIVVDERCLAEPLKRQPLRSDPIPGDAPMTVEIMNRNIYFALTGRIYRRLVPKGSPDDCLALASTEWATDTQGMFRLTIEQFQHCMFELIDLWCPTMDPDDYVAFGRDVLQPIVDKVKDLDPDETFRLSSVYPQLRKREAILLTERRAAAAKARAAGLLEADSGAASVRVRRRSSATPLPDAPTPAQPIVHAPHAALVAQTPISTSNLTTILVVLPSSLAKLLEKEVQNAGSTAAKTAATHASHFLESLVDRRSVEGLFCRRLREPEDNCRHVRVEVIRCSDDVSETGGARSVAVFDHVKGKGSATLLIRLVALKEIALPPSTSPTPGGGAKSRLAPEMVDYSRLQGLATAFRVGGGATICIARRIEGAEVPGCAMFDIPVHDTDALRYIHRSIAGDSATVGIMLAA